MYTSSSCKTLLLLNLDLKFKKNSKLQSLNVGGSSKLTNYVDTLTHKYNDNASSTLYSMNKTTGHGIDITIIHSTELSYSPDHALGGAFFLMLGNIYSKIYLNVL